MLLNISDENLSSVCQLAYELAWDPWLLLVSGFTILLSGLTVFYGAVGVVGLIRQPVFHPNLRVIMTNLLFGSSLYAFGRVVSHGYRITKLIIKTSQSAPPCEYVTVKGACLFLHSIEWFSVSNFFRFFVYEKTKSTLRKAVAVRGKQNRFVKKRD